MTSEPKTQLDVPPGTPVWAAESTHIRPPLEGDCAADVAIVGAGYTGLWTAYYLLKEDPSLRVVVLEREHVGFGASGRNGGWCSAIFPISLDRVAKVHNHQAALDLQYAMNDTVGEVGRAVAAENIHCDFSHQGFLSLARSPAQLARARATANGTTRFGLPDQWQLLGAAEANQRIKATEVKGALFTPHCALVHPGKLVQGLGEAVERLGGKIYENTEVTGIRPSLVESQRGRVNATYVVRATEGYTAQLPGHRRTLVPLYSLVLATEPLPAALRDQLRLNNRFGFNDLRNLRIYAQMTSDGRMVFGGRGAPYHFGSAVEPGYDVNAPIHAKIERTMLELFPALSGTRITHRWGGPLGVPRDWHPSVGMDRATRVAWAGPYVGDGVATSNLAARILRNLILGKNDRLNDLPIVDHQSPQWEVEPLRWALVNMGLLAANAADTEERLTSRPSFISKILEKTTGAH